MPSEQRPNCNATSLLTVCDETAFEPSPHDVSIPNSKCRRSADASRESAKLRISNFQVVLRLLIIGSSAVVQQVSKRGAPKGSWLEQMLARKPRMLVTVALANKMARIVWALLVKQENYRTPVAAKA